MFVQVQVKEEVVEQEDLEGELTCPVCELTLEGYIEMEKHTLTQHSTNKPVVSCNTGCGFKLSTITFNRRYIIVIYFL